MTDAWSRENLAWLAGIIEGEGYIRATASSSLEVTVGMTDKDVLERVRFVAGMGKVIFDGSPARLASGNKPVWRWSVYGPNAYALLVALLPWLHSRRRARSVESLSSWLSARKVA